MNKNQVLETISRWKIEPRPVDPNWSVSHLIDAMFQAYNAARLREACQIFVRKVLAEDCLVGLAVSGALTPAGLGTGCLVPLIRAGFVDWIVSTGANLYHDAHLALNWTLHQVGPAVDDQKLRELHLIRIYDMVLPYEALLTTDQFFRELARQPQFQQRMSTAEFHHRVGLLLAQHERNLGKEPRTLLAVAAEYEVPVYTSSPGDSSIGMNLAALQLEGCPLELDPLRDVNETAAIVYDAKKKGGKSAVLILGGGSPKNFVLQTEPHIQEVLGLPERGHDYFLQFTDARPDTGGLSGATPSEAMTWGKVDPDRLPDSVTCYCDVSIALPLLSVYALQNHPPRPPRRLLRRRAELLEQLRAEYLRQHAAST
jgi:deoxyhypusine synthase